MICTYLIVGIMVKLLGSLHPVATRRYHFVVRTAIVFSIFLNHRDHKVLHKEHGEVFVTFVFSSSV